MTIKERSVGAPFFSIRNLTKNFGGLVAVFDLDLNIHQGEICGLIGPNGAGKSTALNLISGSISPTSGEMILKGEDITSLSLHRRAQKGIGHVFQANILFHNFTALTNVRVGFHVYSKIGFWGSFFGSHYTRSREKALYGKAMEILELTGLSKQADVLAESLPHGKQRALSLAISLAAQPKLLLLDEPVTGMIAEEKETFASIIRELRDQKGITFIIVEHNMGMVMDLCDRVIVLNFGNKIAEGSPKQITENPVVIESYLGVKQDGASN